MLNFRKLRQDFSSAVLKEGRELYDTAAILEARILHLDTLSVRVGSRVRGAFENVYASEIEIDRSESLAIDSHCNCPHSYDCQHIAALLHFLEHHLNEIVVAYSQTTNLEAHDQIDEVEKQQLRETFEAAATKEDKRKDQKYQKEVVREYVHAAHHLSTSPCFFSPEHLDEDKAEIALLFHSPEKGKPVEVQLALRLSTRSKPILVPHAKAFFEAIRYREPILIGGRRFFFTALSFDEIGRELLTILLQYASFFQGHEERQLRFLLLERHDFGTLLARAYDLAVSQHTLVHQEMTLPGLFHKTWETPLYLSPVLAQIKCELEYLELPAPMILLNPHFQIGDKKVALQEVVLCESVRPSLLYKNRYYRFASHVKRVHLQSLTHFHEITIPEPLFGTFIENALPIMRQYIDVVNPHLVNHITTLPYVHKMQGRCVIHYLNGELDAELFFLYDKIPIPAALAKIEYEAIARFITQEGIVARNLIEERKLIEEVFSEFLFDEKEGVFRLKNEKKIVEFMTETIPRTQDRISYECPENLSEQFIYDDSRFELHFREQARIDVYEVEMKVEGPLRGTKMELLWECLAAKKRFIELPDPRLQNGGTKGAKLPRILVLDLDKLTPLVELFDEVGLEVLDNQVKERPLWSLTLMDQDYMAKLPLAFSISPALQQIQKQILGEISFVAQEVPSAIQAQLRNYQIEGVHWLERLRKMHLNGILADDMGLGKTLQAIIAITQAKGETPGFPSLVVCPTSLVYNWEEEFHKFHPHLRILIVDNVPAQRRKLLHHVHDYDVVITSYNLLQKDVELYKNIIFDYAILDEAQHIKNRTTRNAKSVKSVRAKHRLILTGTPIENSLEELWSLFDFLMPGFLSTFDHFFEKYIRSHGYSEDKTTHLASLRKKVTPFVLRRMKQDVLKDLPPISEILYHCHLSEVQKELYTAYAKLAREELSRLVKKEGFDKIQIHVLATLTRLKQICCHPAIFAKETAESGDSAKYEMLLELLSSLIEGQHKTVLFSQYTKMLMILREDLTHKGIPFVYLDGASKNRLDLVKTFNEDPTIPIFLVSLKAGGSGLNFVGADTVIHYDMWWNPAVENQATDRVYRMGQKKSVSAYKLVTLNTIEEKILNLQNRKKGLVKKVISSDDEAISKLTWEEVLELLQT